MAMFVYTDLLVRDLWSDDRCVGARIESLDVREWLLGTITELYFYNDEPTIDIVWDNGKVSARMPLGEIKCRVVEEL